MTLLYGASLAGGAYLSPLPSPAFDFGTDDFTVTATIMTTAGGPVVTRTGATGAGWSLAIASTGVVMFETRDGNGDSTYIGGAPAATLLDGACHVVTAVRSATGTTVYADGVAVTSSPAGPLDVDNDLPLRIGATQDTTAPLAAFTGMVMNVSVWATALSGDALVAAMFGRIAGTEPGLRGAWTLHYTTADLSSYQNPANMAGPVTFMPCVSCAWTSAANDFAFARMTNNPSPAELAANGPAATLAESLRIVVPSGAPALAVSIMSTSDVPAFPAGATFSITDPSGNRYTSDVNTDALFVATSGGQPWALMAIAPAAGSWLLDVTAPSTTGFVVNAQVVPTANIVTTVSAALAPLYGDPSVCRELHAELLDGWFSFLVDVAVAAVVGVAVAGLVVVTGGAALPAVAAGIGAFAVTLGAEVAVALPEVHTGSLNAASGQIAGLAGFVVAVQRVQLVDANVVNDPATQLIYKRRLKVLYPYVALSPFNGNKASLVADQDTRTAVGAALAGFSAGFASMSGHGMAFYLTGWYIPTDPSILEQVLTTGKYAPAEAAGKIFHMFACNCGYSGASPGLGIDLVNHGAVAFFGYSAPFALLTSEYPTFCDCDIEIDKALIDGADCDTAYQRAKAKYLAAISRYIVDGNMNAASALQGNLDLLVAPSTNPAYGNKSARLQVANP